MLNKELKAEIIRRLNIKGSQFYPQIDKIRKEYGIDLMPIEVAVCLLAVKAKVNPRRKKFGISSKILEEATQIQKGHTISPQSSKTEAKQSRSSKARQSITVTINKKFKLTDPVLPQKRLDEAKLMTEVYPVLYVFENSIREVIQQVLKKNFGEDWWNEVDLVNPELKKKIEKRMDDEELEPWHDKRGSQHPIFYTDFGELSEIITYPKAWKVFKDIIGRQEFIKSRIKEICLSRNIIMHSNPLSKHDQRRLEVYFEDWIKLVEAKKDLILH